jgi:hypothetical protein
MSIGNYCKACGSRLGEIDHGYCGAKACQDYARTVATCSQLRTVADPRKVVHKDQLLANIDDELKLLDGDALSMSPDAVIRREVLLKLRASILKYPWDDVTGLAPPHLEQKCDHLNLTPFSAGGMYDSRVEQKSIATPQHLDPSVRPSIRVPIRLSKIDVNAAIASRCVRKRHVDIATGTQLDRIAAMFCSLSGRQIFGAIHVNAGMQLEADEPFRARIKAAMPMERGDKYVAYDWMAPDAVCYDSRVAGVFDAATGMHLDKVAELNGLKRKGGETDESLRARLYKSHEG